MVNDKKVSGKEKENGAAGGPARDENHLKWYAGTRPFGSAMKKKRKLRNTC